MIIKAAYYIAYVLPEFLPVTAIEYMKIIACFYAALPDVHISLVDILVIGTFDIKRAYKIFIINVIPFLITLFSLSSFCLLPSCFL